MLPLVPEGFSSLTTLSKFILHDGCLFTSDLRPIMGLQELEHLSVYIADEENEEAVVAGLHLESSRLTKLEIDGDFQSPPVCIS